MKPIAELPEHWQMWYQEWDAGVPENENKRRLQGELLGEPGSHHSYSAAFELFLFSTFNKMGLSVDFQPEINGVNPDFYISDKRGYGSYVEAGVMFSNPLGTELSFFINGDARLGRVQETPISGLRRSIRFLFRTPRQC